MGTEIKAAAIAAALGRSPGVPRGGSCGDRTAIERRTTPGAGAAGPAGAATMRAAVQRRYGAPAALHVAEIETPLPGRGDVLVQTGATAVHPGDYFVMTGEPYVVRLMFGLRRPRHGIPGRDLAGVVVLVPVETLVLQRSGKMSPPSAPATRCSAGAPREHWRSTRASQPTTSYPCLPTCRSSTRRRCPRRP